ncbi:MAG: MAPEG family protein [Halioglobus sp.]
MDISQTYSLTVLALGAMTLLMLVQLLVSDVIGIRAKHLPGSPVVADHANLLFRATRTVANTNESIAVFIVAVLFCMMSGASPQATGYAAWAFVACRLIYALFYYANLQTLRSVIFAGAIISLVALLASGFLAWA